MRRSLRRDLAARRQLSLVASEGEITDEELARRLLVAQHGPRCAAWLVNDQREHVRKRGYFVIKIPADFEVPMWLSIALRCLRERTSKWTVEEHCTKTSRIWKIIRAKKRTLVN